MKRLLTIIVAAMLAVTTLFSLTACGNEKDPNKLYVGMECAYAPFNYTQVDDSNNAVKISNAQGYANGYDVMIAKKIAEDLGKELVVVKCDWKSLVPEIQAGTLDFIIAGMSPTAERLEQIDFSDAYYESQLVIVVRKDGKYANASKLADFNGAKIVAQNGTFHDKALNAHASNNDPIVSATVRNDGLLRQNPLADFPAMINELKLGLVDGYVAEEPGAVADCAQNSDFTYIHLVNNNTGFTASAEDVQIAVGLAKGSAIKADVNAALAKITSAQRLELMQQATDYSVASVDEVGGCSGSITTQLPVFVIVAVCAIVVMVVFRKKNQNQ